MYNKNFLKNVNYNSIQSETLFDGTFYTAQNSKMYQRLNTLSFASQEPLSFYLSVHI